MGNNIHAHTEWCIIRFCQGRFERAREGYKTPENARRSIPSVAKSWIAEGGDATATYAVGRYIVGEAVAQTGFMRGCA